MLTGTLTDIAGKGLPGGEVQLMQGALKVATGKSDGNGNYYLITTANEQPYRLVATFDDLVAESAEAVLQPAANKIDLQLRVVVLRGAILRIEFQRPP